jgi:Raf kinase inhibitor-like YbhB/YbcL family protein
MQLTCSAFQDGRPIPLRYTCDGDDLSPELSWRDIPSGTKSLALFLHDPDAPREGGFMHWVVYDIDPAVNRIPENAPKTGKVAGLGLQGKNDTGKIGYIGPCPPSGNHRYIVRLFALDSELRLKDGLLYQQVQQAMEGHVLDSAETTGTYSRSMKAAG